VFGAISLQAGSARKLGKNFRQRGGEDIRWVWAREREVTVCRGHAQGERVHRQR
jgi:hypothetical protein